MKMYSKSAEKSNTIGLFATFLTKCYTALFYRIKTIGMESIPPDGSALLVANHVTTIDAILIAAACSRRICFVINSKLLENSKLSWLLKLMNVIPVSSSMPENEITTALQKAKKELVAGHLVCIFPEEDISGNGNLRQFKRYLLYIVKNSDAPIIPLYIGGAWGSTFSNFHESLISTRKHKHPYHITLTFGSKRPAETSMEELRLIIQKLSVSYFNSLKSPNRNLPYYFIKTARSNWLQEAIADTTGKRLSFGKTLIASIALSKKLAEHSSAEEKVGVVLPASVGGNLANVALTLRNRIPVNLNFSTSTKAVTAAINQCNIHTVITTRKLLRNIPHIKIEANLIYIEDLIKSITKKDKFVAVRQALFSSPNKISGGNYAATDDLATIIFSSGSTGDQKGIMLSHHNIISNIESFLMVYHFKGSDKMCAVLPFFHSFGFTTTLWCPLIRGFTAFYHPNPLDSETIARIVSEEKLTIMLATPTFLTTYIRKATEKDFTSLRLIITGAEKLRDNISNAYIEKYNICPIEGYGATELSPVAAANVPDLENSDIEQIGIKVGSIGHPIPGTAMRITDIETREPLPLNQEGMLEVKGPNIMLGYFNNQDLTNSVIREGGWYITGDIARIDEDGFVFIHDRISRFSKIGGEMVPHMLIEEILISKLKLSDHAIFVASAPDQKRGEQLIVIYATGSTTKSALRDVIHESEIPNLWKPRRNNYIEIGKMPVTGSGKLDMRSLSQIAHDFIENKPSMAERTINKIRESL